MISYTARQKAFLVEADESHLETLTALDFVQFIEPIFDAELTAAPHDGDARDDHERSSSPHQRWRHDPDRRDGSRRLGPRERPRRSRHLRLGLELHQRVLGVGRHQQRRQRPRHARGWHLFGRGIAEVDQMGNAPGLGSWNTGRIFNYRRFPNPCGVGTDVIVDRFSNSVTDSNGNTTRRPHVVNNSWGASAAPRRWAPSSRLAWPTTPRSTTTSSGLGRGQQRSDRRHDQHPVGGQELLRRRQRRRLHLLDRRRPRQSLDELLTRSHRRRTLEAQRHRPGPPGA